MSDRLFIRGLRVATHIGATEEERSREQYVLIDIEIAAPLDRAGTSDRLEDTIDYDSVVEEVAALVRSCKSHLLEHLAAKIAEMILAIQDVASVTVEVAKERPPVRQEVTSISVRMERSK